MAIDSENVQLNESSNCDESKADALTLPQDFINIYRKDVSNTIELLKNQVEQITASEADNSKELSEMTLAKTGVVEKMLLLASGTFVLSLNFVTTVSSQLRIKGIQRIDTRSLHILEAAWILLFISVLSCCIAWALTSLDAQRLRKIRQLKLATKNNERYSALTKPLSQLVKMIGDLLITTKKIDQNNEYKMVEKMGTAIFDQLVKKHQKEALELESFTFQRKFYGWLLLTVFISVPVAFLLLLIFSIGIIRILLI
jgi:hypothetical protein